MKSFSIIGFYGINKYIFTRESRSLIVDGEKYLYESFDSFVWIHNNWDEKG